MFSAGPSKSSLQTPFPSLLSLSLLQLSPYVLSVCLNPSKTRVASTQHFLGSWLTPKMEVAADWEPSASRDFRFTDWCCSIFMWEAEINTQNLCWGKRGVGCLKEKGRPRWCVIPPGKVILLSGHLLPVSISQYVPEPVGGHAIEMSLNPWRWSCIRIH